MSRKCEGCESCHWCGSPCSRQWTHDDPPLLPGQKRSQYAARPGNAWVCVGCWSYRRPSVTVHFLGGGLKDRQTLSKHSWLLTGAEVRGIRVEDAQAVYRFLLNPKPPFALSLLGDREGNGVNQIQLAKVNDVAEVTGGTVFRYTLDGREYEYSPYELEEALRHGGEGKPGGIGVLVNWLGPCDFVARVDPDEERERGRPRKEERERLPNKRLK